MDDVIKQKLRVAAGKCRDLAVSMDFVLHVPSEQRLRDESGDWLDQIEEVHCILVGVRGWVLQQEQGATGGEAEGSEQAYP